jgi:hypothetical protein
MQAERPERVSLPRPIPVVIFYTTAIVDDRGRAHFLPDVYDFDDRLGRALAAARHAANDNLEPLARGLPAPHATRIDVDEVGRRVVPDAAGAKR